MKPLNENEAKVSYKYCWCQQDKSPYGKRQLVRYRRRGFRQEILKELKGEING